MFFKKQIGLSTAGATGGLEWFHQNSSSSTLPLCAPWVINVFYAEDTDPVVSVIGVVFFPHNHNQPHDGTNMSVS